MPCASPFIAPEETAGLDWLSTQILGCISPALGLPWILDIDVTVKPLYGHQLPRYQWPTFSRGDCDYGNEGIMLDYGERGLPYLFKMRHTAKVKEPLTRIMRQEAHWQDCGDDWQAL